MSVLHPKERESMCSIDTALSCLFSSHPQYQDLESTLMSLGRWVTEEEKNTIICGHVDEPKGHYVKQNKLGKKDKSTVTLNEETELNWFTEKKKKEAELWLSGQAE